MFNVIHFLIIALAIFLVVRQINKLQAKPASAPAAAPTARQCPYCFTTSELK